MLRIGAHISSAGGIYNSVSRIESIGGNCLQVFAGSPRGWARKLWEDGDVQKFREEASKKDLLPLFIHALYLVNLGTDSEELLEKSIDSLVMDMRNGERAGASGVIVHLGSHQGRGFSDTQNQVVLAVNKILDSSESIPFVIENSSGQKGKIGSLEEIGELFRELKNERVKLCLDTAHLYEAGYDLRKTEVVEGLVDSIKGMSLLEHLVCIHLNDSKTKLGSAHDQHANLGEGEIGLEGLRKIVIHPAFARLPFILEVPGLDKKGPDRENVSRAKSLAVLLD